MSQYDARRSLDDIRQYGDSAREAYVRHTFATPYAVVSALMLFLIYAAIDLESPWRMILTLTGFALGLGSIAVGHRRAPVRRRPSLAELAFCVAWGIGLIMVYGAARIAADLLGLPVPGVIAAGVLAVASIVMMVASRPLYRSLLRREAGRR